MIWGLKKYLPYILWICHEVHKKIDHYFTKIMKKYTLLHWSFFLADWPYPKPLKSDSGGLQNFLSLPFWTCVQKHRIVGLICMVFGLLYEISIEQFGSNPGRHRYTIQDIIQKQSNYGFRMALWIAFRWLSIFHQ